MLLAISGAGAKGPVLLQMYTRLRETHRPTAVAGISAGGILGLFASLHKDTKEAPQKEVQTLLKAFEGIQAHFLKPWYKYTLVNAIASWFYHDSLYQSGSLLQLATMVANSCSCPTLNLPLTLGVWDTNHGVYKEKTFPKGTLRGDQDLLDHIVASASVPLMFPGKTIEGRTHRDGALGHEIPVRTIVLHPGKVLILTAHCLSAPPREPKRPTIKDVGQYLIRLRGFECMERDLFHILDNKRWGQVRLSYPRQCVRAKYKGSKKQLEALKKAGDDVRSMPLEQWCIEIRIAAALRL